MTEQHLDLRVILDTTQSASREQALKVRESLRLLLRTLEDVHGLPYSFELKRPKGELSQREIDQQRKQQ